MRTICRFLLSALLVSFIWSCQKADPPTPTGPPAFDLTFYNELTPLDARLAVFLSDETGAVRAFRWLPAQDSAHVNIRDAETGDKFDCTVVKITTLSIPSIGLEDTTVALTTYTGLATGGEFHLRNTGFGQNTTLNLTLTNLGSLDSIVVPDGITFAQPQGSNNFQGVFNVFHTGRFWLRLLANGEHKWRYAQFDNVSGASLAATLDVAALPTINEPPKPVTLPFLAAWDCRTDRVVDTAQRQFLAIGDAIRVPGSPVPIFDRLDVFEPPATTPVQGYRLRVSGTDPTPGSYGCVCDRFFPGFPAALSTPAFDILPTTLADGRLVSVQCSGAFDVLAITRHRTATPQLDWEVLAEPVQTGFFIYRLPDVPAELAALYSGLGKYQFDKAVRVRAEAYDLLDGYLPVIARHMASDDPLWQMKAGYVGRERVF